MAMVTIELSERLESRGPVFDGRAAELCHEVVRAAAKDLAESGTRNIKAAAGRMDRSGRGGTGHAAAGVILGERSYGWLIFGAMNQGEVWWPWLEGKSQRNRSTRFKGYHTFRKEGRRMNRDATSVLQARLDERIAAMGGE